MRLLGFAPLLLVLVLTSGCDSEPEAAPVGVNDVKKACEIRVAWTKTDAQDCKDCLAFAPSPACNCPAVTREYSAKCSQHREARIGTEGCYDAEVCAGKCAPSECGCAEACYAAAPPRCKEIANALNGCVAEVCQPSCQ